MPREILNDATAPAQPVPPRPAAQQAPQPATPLPQDMPDALAGALPTWDLLPASPFIRRVK